MNFFKNRNEIMHKNNIICPYYCLLSTNQCYYCHLKSICCNCSSCSISIDEILTWFISCLLIVVLYNTIKLCIIFLLIFSMIYWIYKQTDIPQVLKEFFNKQYNSWMNRKNSSNEQIIDASENEPASLSSSTKSVPDSNTGMMIASKTSLNKTDNVVADDDDDNNRMNKTVEKSKRTIHEKKRSLSSTMKKLLIDHSSSSLNESNKLNISKQFSSYKDSIQPNDHILSDIRQSIETLHEDILELKNKSDKEGIRDSTTNLSTEEQTILKSATKNLIQAILSNRHNKNLSLSNEKIRESSPPLFNGDEKISISVNPINQQDISIHHPKCVTFQPSFAINSPMPRVPTRSTVTAIDENDTDDEKSYDNHINSSKPLITTNEQFENILPKANNEISEDSLYLKNSIAFKTDQLDWPYYSTKPDIFPNDIHSDLPIVQSESQHLSFKQTLFSRLHRRPKFPSTNNLSTFHSSSLNANNYIKTFQSNINFEQQQITEKFFVNKISFKYIWNKTLNHINQRIFRVRKSRIIVSFDDIQAHKHISDSHQNDNIKDISQKMNHGSTQLIVKTEQETQIEGPSTVSILRGFDTTVSEGELLIHYDKSMNQNHSENNDCLSEISNSLYSVTRQLILT